MISDNNTDIFALIVQHLANITEQKNLENGRCNVAEKKGANTMVVSKKTRTVLKNLGGLIAVSKYKDGNWCADYPVMPDIVDVRIYNDEAGSPCATYLDFADGTSTSAARREDDVYSIEHGISICITKKLLDLMTTNGAGSQVYNKVVRYAYKVLDNKKKDIEQMSKEAEALAHKREKLAEKKRRRDERRNAQVREELIEIQKEAILRALREHTINEDDLK